MPATITKKKMNMNKHFNVIYIKLMRTAVTHMRILVIKMSNNFLKTYRWSLCTGLKANAGF